MGVLTFSAGLYLLVGAEFLAGVQILVYVGGIVVLLVFAVMLTRSSELVEDRPSVKRKVLGFIASTAFFTSSLWAIATSPFKNFDTEIIFQSTNTKEIGRKFLDNTSTGYVLPFELISLLLLAVLIGGIVIARNSSEKGEEE